MSATNVWGRPAVFLDRDGVIIANRDDYIKSWREVEFLPGAIAALRRLSQSNFAIVVVTNQSAIGRGIISLQQANDINRRVMAEIKAQGGRIDACYVCPHHPNDRCGCRKPAPGLLLRASQELELDLPESYMVGDAITDLQAARAAGVQGILVRTGRGEHQARLLDRQDAFLVVADLEAALVGIQSEAELAVHREERYAAV